MSLNRACERQKIYTFRITTQLGYMKELIYKYTGGAKFMSQSKPAVHK